MVDLPSIPDTVPELRAPRPMVSPGQIAQPYEEFAQTLDKSSGTLNEVAKNFAQQAGFKAVSRDPQTGELQIAKTPLIVGDAADAYHRALKFTALAQGEAEAKQQDLLLSKQFHQDPAGYLKAAQGFRDKHVQEFAKAAGEDVGIALGKSIDNATTYNYRWLLLEQQRTIKHDFDRSTRAKIQDLDTDIFNLIKSGDKNSPDLQAKINERIRVTHERVFNPVLAAPKGEAEVDLKQFDEKVGASRFVADVNGVIKAKGIDAAQQVVDGILDRKDLSATQRALNHAYGAKAINDYTTALTKQAHLNDTIQKNQDQLGEDAIIRDSSSGNPKITETDIKNSGLSPAAKMRMLNWKKRDDMPEPMAQVSQTTSMDLFRRMSLPEGDPNRINSLGEIRDAYANKGLLKREDEEWLEKRFTEARTPEGQRLTQIRTQFSKAVEPSIDKSNPLLGKIDQSGKMQSYAFERFVDQKVDEYRKAGKSPYDLFDPNKPDYLGKPEIIKQFETTVQQSIFNIGNIFRRNEPVKPAGGTVIPPAAPAAPPQRQPGESPADYLKRIGAQ